MERKVLKASAGTGKTYRLSLEYAVSLFNGEKIKDIIIMTFTRKAAGEIKEDIIKFIKKLAVSPKDTDSEKEREGAVSSIMKIYPEMFSSPEEIYKKAEKAYKDIILNKDNLKIFTIDGLKNTIFKTAIAPMLNINNYDIIDDSLNTEYLRKCFEKIFKSKKDFDLLKDFLADNMEKNIDNYVGVIGNIINERWKSLVIEKKEREPYKVLNKLNQIDKSLEVIEKIAEEKGKNIEEFINSSYKPYLSLKTDKEKEKFIVDKWAEIFKQGIRNGNKIKGKNFAEEIEELNFLYEELLKELAKRLYNTVLIDYEKNIFSFLERVYTAYDEIKFREKKLTQTDITNYTLEYISDKRLNLVDENGITQYMKDILESGITTVFIDEFQDTSVVQWKIFKSMIDSAEKVICVGDEKQSIYEWRGGEKDLFVNLSEIINGKEETMGTSYRSRKKIVDFTNKFFSKYSAIAKSEGINWNFEPVESSDDKDRGYVEIRKTEEGEENCCEKVAEIIKEKFNGNYQDICVLARNNDTLSETGEFLSENHIPYFLETNLNIFSHRTTEPVIKFMKYLVYDNIFYLAEFLRDNLILISDKSLKELFSFKGEIKNFSFSDSYAENIFKKVLSFKEKYDEDRYESSNIPEMIIKELGILKKYDRESDIQNIYRFIEISKRFLNIREFLNEIKENGSSSEYKQSSMEAENSVSLMTVHKSKGLGFNTVFYIYKKSSPRKESGLQFNVIMSKDYNKVENYFIINSKYEKILKYLEGQFDYEDYKERKREEEEINNLYVAFTRSKQNFFIIINEKTLKNPPKKIPPFKEVIDKNFLSEDCVGWSNGKFELKELKKETEILSEDEKFLNFELDFSKYEYNEEKLKENREKIKEDEERYSTEREEKREIGNIVHYFLENLIYNNESEREKAYKAVVIKYGASFGKERIENILKSSGMEKFLSENSEIFSREWDYIYPEYSIYSDENSELYRIDRLMIKLPQEKEKGKILIADYKTGGFEESQLEKYYRAVKARIKEPENYIIEKVYLKIDI